MRWAIRLQRSQRGDTIVEVLLVTAVLGLILGSSYGIAGLSLRNMRQAQERGEALKVAEGQLESLRVVAARNNADTDEIFRTNNTFCLNLAQQGAPLDLRNSPRVTQPATADDFANYPAGCINGLYHSAIEVDLLSTNRYQFTVYVRWDSLGGNGRDEVVMRYRMLREN